jgi:hypothetical protein
MFGLSGEVADSEDSVISLPETYLFAFNPKGVSMVHPRNADFCRILSHWLILMVLILGFSSSFQLLTSVL